MGLFGMRTAVSKAEDVPPLVNSNFKEELDELHKKRKADAEAAALNPESKEARAETSIMASEDIEDVEKGALVSQPTQKTKDEKYYRFFR